MNPTRNIRIIDCAWMQVRNSHRSASKGGEYSSSTYGKVGTLHKGNRVVIAIAIQVQAIDGFGAEICGVVRRDEPSPLGAVVSGVAVVQAGVVIVVIATVTDGVGVCHIVAGGLAGIGAVAPGVVQILGLQRAVGIVDSNHIALQIPLEVVCVVGASHLHFTIFLARSQEKASQAVTTWEANAIWSIPIDRFIGIDYLVTFSYLS